MATSPDRFAPLRALLSELKADDYVRFKYGKRLEAAAKLLEGPTPVDMGEIEARLEGLLTLVRGERGGAPARARSKRTPKDEPP